MVPTGEAGEGERDVARGVDGGEEAVEADEFGDEDDAAEGGEGPGREDGEGAGSRVERRRGVGGGGRVRACCRMGTKRQSR